LNANGHTSSVLVATAVTDSAARVCAEALTAPPLASASTGAPRSTPVTRANSCAYRVPDADVEVVLYGDAAMSVAATFVMPSNFFPAAVLVRIGVAPE
jgi:hypothetical protein